MNFDAWWKENGVELASYAEKSAAKKAWAAAVAAEREALKALYADAQEIFNNPPSETSQDVRDVIEWYAAAIRARGEK